MLDDQENRENEVACRLLWLRESGVTLPSDLAKRLESWEEQQQEREAASKTSPTLEERFSSFQRAVEVAELVAGEGEDQLSPWEVSFSLGDSLAGWLDKHPDQAVDLFADLLARGTRGEGLASRVVSWLMDHERYAEFQKICSILIKSPNTERNAHLVSSLAWTVKSVAEKKLDFEGEPGFWVLWSFVARVAAESSKPVEPHESDPLTDSLNAPGGYLAQALIFRMHQEENESTLRCDGLRKRLETLSNGESDFHFLARIMLASRLPWLHHLDPEWARNALIAGMGWSGAEPTDEARGLWEGYLWAPQLNPALLVDLRPAFIQALGLHFGIQGNENLFALFAELLLRAPEKFVHEEKKKVLADMPVEGLVACANYWRQVLEGANEGAADVWTSKMDTIVQKYWPVLAVSVNSETVEALARLSIRTREAFPKALDTLTEKALLAPKARGFLIHEIAEEEKTSEYKYVSKHPHGIVDLLDQSIKFDNNFYEENNLGYILAQARRADVSVEQTSAFGRLSQRVHNL